jgi:NAD(P)-dependent dehydrogenase (short-subunit alcohol dehydrogenase family)
MNTVAGDLTGKRVAVIGAAGILGTVFCEALAVAGANVVVADLDLKTCRARADTLSREFGVDALGFGIDIADEKAVGEFREAVNAAGFAPDVLVNAAAAKSDNFFAPLAEFRLDEWEQVLRVNVTGIFLTCRAFVPDMIARGGGTIVNIGSIYGELGPDQRIYEGSDYPEMGGAINTPLVYSATKGAVSAITRYLATSFGGQGIRANTLVPGGVASGQNDVFNAKYAARVPVGRMAQRSEIASALVFLASDASAYVNGQELLVDGGLSAW